MIETLLCEEARELIEPSLDGELATADEARLQEHLKGCTSCACEMRLALRIQNELRRLRLAEVIPLARHRRPIRPARMLLAAALVALTVGGALVLEQMRIQPADQPSPAEVARATAEARFALAYVGKVSRSTGLDLRDGLLRGHLPPVPSDSGPAER